MSSYRNIEAIIESKKLDLSPKMTMNFDVSESQRTEGGFHSETERLALCNTEIEEYALTKKKLDLVYNSLKCNQKEIWDRRYIDGRFDTEVYHDLGIPDRTYYRLKREMIAIVADAFDLIK